MPARSPTLKWVLALEPTSVTMPTISCLRAEQIYGDDLEWQVRFHDTISPDKQESHQQAGMQLVRKTVCITISACPALIDSRSDSLNGAKRPLTFMCSLLRGSDVGSSSLYKLAFLMRRPSLRAVTAACC